MSLYQFLKGKIGFTVPKMDTVPNFMPRTVSDCKLSNTVNTKVVNFAAPVVKLMAWVYGVIESDTS